MRPMGKFLVATGVGAALALACTAGRAADAGAAGTAATTASRPASRPTSRTASRPATAPAKLPFVIADCTAFKDKELHLKFRIDGNFERYIATQFTFPAGEAKGAQVGKSYVFTFKGDDNPHTAQGIELVDERDPPKDLGDHCLIGRAVAVEDKSVTVEIVRDENVKRFFAREMVYTIRNNQPFAEGQVIRVTFGKDNRHIQNFAIISGKK
ncbi:MAG: hypothetical protein ACE15C_14105 [Phycisphaerae bacterium]